MSLAAVWEKARAGYTEAVLLLFMPVLFFVSYFGVTGALPPIMFIAGLLCIGCFNPLSRAARAFWPVMAVTGAVLILGFLRSDFVAMMVSGKDIGAAWQASHRYFLAPMIMWFTTWALILAASTLSGHRARRTLTWTTWLVLATFAVDAIDAVGNIGLRYWLNTRGHLNWSGPQRPEMFVVDASNLNTFLLMLVWPLTFWFARKGWTAAIIFMIATVLWASVTVDTNAQAITFLASVVVFAMVRYWPAAWSRRGALPERVLAGLAAFGVLVFPLIIIGLMRAGLTKPLHDHLPASWAARIDIWSYAVSRALEKPWFGWGYESARLFDPHIPVHPHNLSLQAWLELGIPGLLMMAGLWFCIFWYLAPRGSEAVVAADTNSLRALDEAPAAGAPPALSVQQLARPYVLAAAANYFLLNVQGYGMWKQWLHCLAAMMLIVTILVIKAAHFETKADNAG